MITVARPQGLSIHVPDQFCAEFMGVIRRGMAFEHGQSQVMYDFCDRLEALIDAPPAATCIEAHQQFNPASVERK